METTLLKVPEVAFRLSISRAKVYELLAAGELRSVALGGSRPGWATCSSRFGDVDRRPGR
jgi:excisionase family DNA binding protein